MKANCEKENLALRMKNNENRQNFSYVIVNEFHYPHELFY